MIGFKTRNADSHDIRVISNFEKLFFCKLIPYIKQSKFKCIRKQGGTYFDDHLCSFVDHLCYSCLVFVMLSRLSIAALWSPAGKGLTS